MRQLHKKEKLITDGQTVLYHFLLLFFYSPEQCNEKLEKS